LIGNSDCSNKIITQNVNCLQKYFKKLN